MIESGGIYTGIGSRDTPSGICGIMTNVATKLHDMGMILRSGAAVGADTAFENGVVDNSLKEIYLPWPGFEYRPDSEGFYCSYTDQHKDIAKSVHTGFLFLSKKIKSMHTRNVAQILGRDCETPTNFVVCWTCGGRLIGGTATAIKIAYKNSIPVYNLFFEKARDAIVEFVLTGHLDKDAWKYIT